MLLAKNGLGWTLSSDGGRKTLVYAVNMSDSEDFWCESTVMC